MKTKIKTVALLLLFLSFLGCSSPCKKTLTINIQGDPSSLHPLHGFDLNARFLQKLVFEGLTRLDSFDNPQLALAESYTVSSDFKRYTFTIREAYYSNHQKITAYDFEASWKKAILPDSTCLRPDLFYSIKNAKKIKEGLLSVDQFGVYCLDEKTLVIDLERPTPYLLNLLSHSLFSALPNISKDDVNVFSGPFVLDSWTRDHYIRFKKNPSYWDEAHVYLPQIDFTLVKDARTALLMYEKNEIDWIGSPFTMLNPDEVHGLKKENCNLENQDILGVFWICLNTHSYPLNSLKIRQALSAAIDREFIAHQVIDDQTPTSGIFTLLEETEKQDIAKAKQLYEQGLEELGISKEEFPTLEISYASVSGQKQIVQALAAFWENHLGIKTQLKQNEWNIFFNSLTSKQYQIGGCIWFALYDDPCYFLDFFTEPSLRYNPPGWNHPEFSKSLNQAHQTEDPLLRMTLLKNAEKVLIDQCPILPLFRVKFHYLKKPELKDAFLNKLGHVELKSAYLKETRRVKP